MAETRRHALIGLGALLLSLVVPAHGAGQIRGRPRRRSGWRDEDRGGARDPRRRYARLLPLRRLIIEVERTFHGKVVGVQFQDSYGMPIYRFALISPESLLLEIWVDGWTGRVWAVDGR